MSAIGHWLVQQGAVKDLVAFAIGAGCAWVIGLWRRLKRIERLLDTSEPGGLTDVVDVLEAYQNAQLDPEGRRGKGARG